MAIKSIVEDSLVVYKTHPGRVLSVGDKISIALENGNLENVRFKDIQLIHPGPIHSFDGLHDQEGEVELAWEIMLEDRDQSEHTLVSLAELVYGEYTPASAWGAWELIQDGLYFGGEIDAVVPCPPEEVKAKITRREAKAAKILAWDSFLERVKKGEGINEVDRRFMVEVENLAYGKTKRSRLLLELGRAQTPQTAHALLLELGWWDAEMNPYPRRMKISTEKIKLTLSDFPAEDRLDLTHLACYAIDDRDNLDPDDAISLEKLEIENGEFAGARLWVHVADAAWLAAPDSDLDLEARARSATLYLPEGMLPMLPQDLINTLGLGLKEESPAFSFGITLNEKAEIIDVEIAPSMVQVQRLSYKEADMRVEESPLSDLLVIAEAYGMRREANRATIIDMPEAKISVKDGVVEIRPLPERVTRSLVREAMLMAGEAAAGYAVQENIPFPFVVQEPIDEEELAERLFGENLLPGMLAYSYAQRRLSQRSQLRLEPSPHAGVGLANYSRVTSPLRRYLDLVAHQQLHTFLKGGDLINESGMLERIGAAQSMTGSVNQTEWLSRRHWTCVYFEKNPDWSGEGVLVEQRETIGKVIIPQLAFETQIHLRRNMPLNTTLNLRVKGVNLPELEAYFEVE